MSAMSYTISCVERKKNKYCLSLKIIVYSSDNSYTYTNTHTYIDILEEKETIYQYTFT